ncbi:RAI1 protein, partial [Herpetotheres cachinnans]|nr:RAI1 protein [Herpetotheres cachinnans]
MQSFRERCGFHGNQQSYQPTSQDTSRLENYRHQSQAGPNCERQRLVAKEYYSQQQLPYSGYENSAVEKYHRGNKQLAGQQLQGRPAFSNYAVQENSPYPARYSGDESLQAWGGPPPALPGGVAKYEDSLMKTPPALAGGRPYHEPAAASPPPRTHFQQQQQQQQQQQPPPQQQQQQPPALPYPKLPPPKLPNDVSSPMPFSQSPPPGQHSQSFPASSTYSSAPPGSQPAHSYKSCTAPSAPPPLERPLGSAASLAPGPPPPNLHGYQPNRIGYEQPPPPPPQPPQPPPPQPPQPPPPPQPPQPLQGRHHAPAPPHYQNLAKYQHYNQPGPPPCQGDAPPVRTPEQYYPPPSPSASHSPARSVGRSPPPSSTPSPLMPNLENFQSPPQPLSAGAFPAGIADHTPPMPLLNPSPTDGTSPDAQSGNCKNLQKEKLPENLLSDLSLQSLTALTSQVENISNTVQQLLLSKAAVPQKTPPKTPARTPEQLKGQHCTPPSSTYSAEQVGTPLSDPPPTPQSVHAETQDADYLTPPEDQLERSFLYCNQNRTPPRVNSNSKAKPESVSTSPPTSPDDMSTKSDDSFQSIHASLPLETFTKYVTNEPPPPRLLLSALSQEELASEIIVLQDAISEKADKAWANLPMLSKEATKSPFQLENHRPCLDSMVKGTWPSQGDSPPLTEPLKLDKASGASAGKDFSEEVYEGPQVEFAAAPPKDTLKDAAPLAFNSKPPPPAATSSAGAAGYSCYSNTTANSVGSENTMEHFESPPESLGEVCLRWKELQATDLPKGLFPSKLVGSCKEKKNACSLDLCDGEQPAKSEPARDFGQQAMEEEEEETLTYDEASKADSERWLQDTPPPCSTGDFSEIPIISSPELKESDLEAEEYSSLCELAGSEQKSVTYDASPPKPPAPPAVLSSSEVPVSAEETVSTMEKESSGPAARLSGQSVILLGPAVGTETKVKSWSPPSLPHIQPEEESGGGETSHPEAADAESTPSVTVKQQLGPENTLGKTEPVSRGKSLRNKRVHCRLPEGDGPGSAMLTPFDDLPAAGSVATPPLGPDGQAEILSKNAHTPPPRFPAEGLPARMCTRSPPALAEPRAPAPLEGLKAPPHQEKLGKKPACGVKQRVAFKARKRSSRPAPRVVQNASDAALLVPSLVVAEETPPPTPPEGDVVEAGDRDQRSMILRSRTKTQEVFYTTPPRGKRAADVRLKNCKAPPPLISNNHLPPAFKLVATPPPHKEGKVGPRMKLPKAPPGMGGKMSERPLHSLKRKSTFISPIPAKKRNLVLPPPSGSVKEEKPEAPPSLSPPMPVAKKVKAKLPPKSSPPAVPKPPPPKEAPDVCIKITSRAAFQEATKTKVLPPRKGRGLKLEAIVQKITSPNLKKFACKPSATAATAAPPGTSLSPAGAERERAVKHSGVALAAGDVRLPKPAAAQKVPTTPAAEQLCRNPTPPAPKGKLGGGKKLSADGCQGEACPPALGAQPSSTMAAKSLGLLPKKRNRKGKAAALGIAKAPLGPAPLLPPRERAAGPGGGEEAPREGKKPKSEEKEVGGGEGPPEGRPTAGPARGPKPRANHSNYNGYSKRQRKRLAHGKAKAVPARCKSRGKRRRQAQPPPLLHPAEPEIRLKYISSPPLRADSRAPPFAPYVRAPPHGEFTTACTVVNSPGAPPRLQRGPAGPAPRPRAAPPTSSTMHMGPVVSKALTPPCLVCCLCRNPANYKDLGDLCGPYYPEDCLPKKKSPPKEKARVEGPGEDAIPPPPAERAPRGTEGGCGAGAPPARPEGATEAAKQSALPPPPRGMFRRLQSCYCCDAPPEGEEAAEKPRRHECHKAESPPQEPAGDTQEHWLHEACAVWTAGVFLVAGKLYGLQEAVKAAADLKCSSCQQAGATVGCCQKGCPHTYHYACAVDTGCLLTEESFTLTPPKHKVSPE